MTDPTNRTQPPDETAKRSELTDEQLDTVVGGSDLGQKLQFQLQEANNIYTRGEMILKGSSIKQN